MTVYYTIAGTKIASHWLSIGTLSTIFAGSYLMTGGQKKPAQQGPPINASSKDEENFIQEFLKTAEQESSGGAKQREGGGH